MIDHRELREKEVSKYGLELNLEFQTKMLGLNPVANGRRSRNFKGKSDRVSTVSPEPR